MSGGIDNWVKALISPLWPVLESVAEAADANAANGANDEQKGSHERLLDPFFPSPVGCGGGVATQYEPKSPAPSLYTHANQETNTSRNVCGSGDEVKAKPEAMVEANGTGPLSIETFNTGQPYLVATDATPKNGTLGPEDTVTVVRPFAIYESGDVVPFDDAYNRAVRAELLSNRQDFGSPETVEATIESLYGVELKTREGIRDLATHYYLCENGQLRGLIDSDNVVGLDSSYFRGLKFTKQSLSYAVSKRLGAENKIPPVIEYSISPEAQARMDNFGYHADKERHALLDGTKKTIIAFQDRRQEYADVNLAIYIAPGDRPDTIKVIAITKDQHEEGAVVDLTTGEPTRTQ
jgi:hypothetical protein